ncbi:hypothetical protein AVL63_04675 [Nesterenkonia jeotgali]|uniref:Glycosyltransferase 2-like domain-containing protein n=1 Tax=Nesterenkonia jeotgali TaxID=317018 RepID=A0A0W8ICY2_9MICC|nr:hypothetical protein AVL63_04675 [Nesterenkonia jeotgali]
MAIYGFNNVSRRVITQTTTISRQLRRDRKGDSRPTPTTVVVPNNSTTAYWAKQVRSVKGHLPWFTSLAVRNRLIGARDVLAHAATNGRYDFTQLGGLLESSRIPMYRDNADQLLEAHTWKPGLISLARVLYSQRAKDMDLLDALSIYDSLHRWHGSGSLTGVDQSYYADLLTWKGRFAEALEILESTPAQTTDRRYAHGFLGLNAINPNTTGDSRRRHEWLESMNLLLGQSGLTPIGVRNLEAPSFFELQAETPEAAIPLEEQPLVSVIMPIYEPDASTDLAIQSLLNQSWQNLEVLVIDDASPRSDEQGVPTDYRERLQRWADTDKRVRLVFCEENRGAYAVRNDGYDLAAGRFVTVADKDDWHHPQKIELQATELINDPSVKANLGNWVRVSEDLEFLLRWGPDRVVHPSFASLMFRRDEIRETLGYWDTVRKSGDGEFKFRFQLVYGVDLQPTIKAPLAFSLMGSGNLTSSDLGLGFRHDDRHAYQRAYRDWHRQIQRGESSAYMPKHPAERPFVAPPNFLPQRPTEPRAYDIVYLSEFGFEAGNSSVLLQEITTCLEAGLRVGVIPVENGLIASASKRHFVPALERLVLDGHVDRLSVEGVAHTKLLLVRWPACMQLELGKRSRLIADRILVVANHMPYELAGDRRSYDVRTVSENVSSAFGQEPVWAAESERLREYLEDLMPSGALSDSTWKGITVPLDEGARNHHAPDPDRVPVVGRHGRDHPGKWPSTKKDFLSAYPTDGSVDVAILGGASTPIRAGWLPEELPNSWTVYPFNGVSVAEYLRSLDFFVYYHHDDLVEAFGMAILEAMNHGVVCVLPPHFAPVFGDGAVYARPGQVQATIRRLWDEEAYAAQRQRGYEFVRRECSPAAYVARLRDHGVTADSIIDAPQELEARQRV